MTMRVHLLSPDAQVPSYAHETDSGMDLFACENALIHPGESKLIGTGIAIELPASTEAQIRPRSGLATKYGITVLNTPGTVDEGYRGEIKVLLINHSSEDFQVTKGMRIAQMVIAPVFRPKLEVIETGFIRSFSEPVGTSRGARGFGSTGL
ncbi:dUTP diphosphatase [Kamptonema formosum]|uniref:dUTP diphosphatase n=1 Tax=Kamptonema formosum TaxID=331992 RepID=UPI000370612E|nr:dUTP diphosphatase [Oscillatoria sp. PCC 10802]